MYNSFTILCNCCIALKTFVIIIQRICHCLFFCFSANQVNVYMIHQDSDLCYGIFSEIINIIKDKVTTFHCFFQPNLISCKKEFENIFNNLICFIISCDFYDITPQMNYTLFISVFRKNIYNCYC